MTAVLSRFGSVLARLALLVIITAFTGVLVGVQFLPAATTLTDAVSAFERQVLDVPPLPDEEFQPENSFVYAGDGRQLAEISFEQRRIPVTLTEIPDITVEAVLATEDKEFWEHNGLNYQALVRAAIANTQAGEVTQGGSTITQQYVENAYLPVGERFTEIDDKITEALWAIEIEKRLTKEEILEGYLNRIYLGNGVYGVGTAADYYFSKPVTELNLGESAMLAGMIRFPEGNNPVDNPVNARQRRNIVLDQMAADGIITAEQRDAAQAVSIEDMLEINEVDDFTYPFWVDWVTRLLVSEPAAEGLGTQLAALEAMGDTDAERVQAVFQSGLRIHTTLDPEFQDLAQASVDKHLPNAATDPMGAVVSVVPGDGAIVAMAVGPKEYGECKPGVLSAATAAAAEAPAEGATDAPTQQPTPEPTATEPEIATDAAGRLLCDTTKFNPVVPADAGSTRAGRQPGSSFKPFITTAALEQGLPPGWQVESSGPQTIPGCDNGGPWRVNNSGGNGLRDMYSGIAGSSNVFHAKLIKEIGPQAAANMAARLGVTRSNLDPVCALALGAKEVFPLEMASAYATLANRGEYCAPYAITRIEDRTGRVLYQHSPNCTQVVEQAIADRVVDIMKGPVQAGGTAAFMTGALAPYQVRGKTGTTNDYVDAWFVGYTRQLATAAWMGYENGLTTFATAEQAAAACGVRVDTLGETPRCAERRLMTNVTIGGQFRSRVFGGTISAPMWRDFMVEAMKRYEPQGFVSPGALPSTVVPDLLSATSQAEAQQRAEAARLNIFFKTIADYRPAGQFIYQDPDPGTQVLAGRSVTLFISNGEGPAPEVPNVVGMGERDAVILLQSRGYDVVRLTRRVNRDDRCGIVLAQNPDGGEQLPPENGASVVIQTGVDDDGGTCGRGVQDGPPPGGDPDPEPQDPPDQGEPSDDRPGGGNNGGGNNGGGNGGGNGGDDDGGGQPVDDTPPAPDEPAGP